MKFRQAMKSDIFGIMQIIRRAQESLRKLNVDQWQDGYPNEEVILRDIKSGNSYVLCNDKKIIATVMLSFEKDSTYDRIFEGTWISNEIYAVIHRIAIDNEYKGSGIAREFLKCMEKKTIENGVKSIKIDTHKDNIIMQKFLKNNDFEYCGLIYLEDGNERLAYEKVLNKIEIDLTIVS